MIDKTTKCESCGAPPTVYTRDSVPLCKVCASDFREHGGSGETAAPEIRDRCLRVIGAEGDEVLRIGCKERSSVRKALVGHGAVHAAEEIRKELACVFARLDKVHSDTFFEQRSYAATHKCKVCGALWLEHRPTHCGSWSLLSATCGPCCDNVPEPPLEPVGLMREMLVVEKSLRQLMNEVFGLRHAEHEVRVAIGNTNWNVLMARAQEAKAVLQRTAKPATTPRPVAEIGRDAGGAVVGRYNVGVDMGKPGGDRTVKCDSEGPPHRSGINRRHRFVCLECGGQGSPWLDIDDALAEWADHRCPLTSDQLRSSGGRTDPCGCVFKSDGRKVVCCKTHQGRYA